MKLEKSHGVDLDVPEGDILLSRGIKGTHLTDEVEGEEQVKKAKNRESAKNSRERKRVYYKLLEDKFFQQEQVIEDLRKQLNTMREGYTPIDIPQKVTKLKSMQWSQKLDKSQMSVDTDVRDYQEQYCVNGKSRKDQVNQYFDKIEEECFPGYLFQAAECAKKSQDIFSPDESSRNFVKFPAFNSVLHPTQEQKGQFEEIKHKLALLDGSLAEFKSDIQSLKTRYGNLSESCGQVWQSFLDILTVDQKRELYLQFEAGELELANIGEDLEDNQTEAEKNSPQMSVTESKDKTISFLQNSFDYYKQKWKAPSFESTHTANSSRSANLFKVMPADPVLDLLKN